MSEVLSTGADHGAAIEKCFVDWIDRLPPDGEPDKDATLLPVDWQRLSHEFGLRQRAWRYQLDRQHELATSASAKTQFWRNTTGTMEQLADALLRAFPENGVVGDKGSKDNRVFLQGALVGAKRGNAHMVRSTLLVLDYDSGVNRDALIGRLEALGIGAFVADTWSSTPEHRKLRCVILLSGTYDFGHSTPENKLRCDLWSGVVNEVARELGQEHDTACEDPARVFYRSQRPAGSDASHFECVEVHGDGLNLTPYIERAKIAASAVARSTMRRQNAARPTYETPGFGAWMAKHGAYFSLGDLVADHGGTGCSDGWVACDCPRGEDHSNGKLAGATAHNADEHQPAVMKCFHQHKGGGNAPWELIDGFLVQHGLTLADCQQYVDWERFYEDHPDDVGADPLEDIRADAEALTNATPGGDLDAILDRLARHPVSGERSDVEELVRQRTGKTKGVFDRLMRAAERRVAEARRESGASGDDGDAPDDLASFSGAIDAAWDAATVRALIWHQVRAKNERNPVLLQVAGENVRVRDDERGGVRFERLDSGNWLATLNDMTGGFVRGGRGILCPAEFVRDAGGRSDWGFPVCERIVSHPIFAADGSLRTERGYVAEARVYLAPIASFPSVPDTVTQQDADDAVMALRDVLWDVPFSDNFAGDPETDEPQYVCDGAPNWKRGQGSFANYVARLLQSVARELINGPTPIYAVTKPEIGTGAGLLNDIEVAIFAGTWGAATRGAANNQTEFDKRFDAAMISGDSRVVFDNVAYCVESGDFAGAITSGVYKLRILGKTQEAAVRMRATVALTGNNLQLSRELADRAAPIGLDAGVATPSARDTAKFRHPQLGRHVMAVRDDLFRALCVMVKWWVQQGRPDPAQIVDAGRFGEYGRVVGGILERSGIAGFLTNRRAWMDDRGASHANGTDLPGFMQCLADAGKVDHTDGAGKWLELALGDGLDPDANKFNLPIDFKGATPTARGTAFRRFVESQAVKGKRFKVQLPGNGGEAEVMLVRKSNGGGGSKYKLVKCPK